MASLGTIAVRVKLRVRSAVLPVGFTRVKLRHRGALIPFGQSSGPKVLQGVTTLGTPAVPGKALVSLLPSASAVPPSNAIKPVQQMWSDDQGNFKFENLKAGRYYVLVSDSDMHFPQIFVVDL